MQPEELIDWLFANSGPILRYRIAVDLMGLSKQEQAELLKKSLATVEVQRWFKNLEDSKNIHGSKDKDAENALGKLLDYGFNRNIPSIDQKILVFLNSPIKLWDQLTFLPFVLRAGYIDHPLALEWLENRIDKLYESALLGNFNFYLTKDEVKRVPKPWRDKPIYRDEFGHQVGYSLPTCYDFYAMAYCPQIPAIENITRKFETIAAFLSDPRFQTTTGGYGWDHEHKRCYAAGRVFLACVEPTRLVLFLELGANFSSSRQSEWFQQGLAMLERFRTDRGGYCFPEGILLEKHGNHVYGGSHMGLGENRHSPQARELESTFHMLYLYRLMGRLPPKLQN